MKKIFLTAALALSSMLLSAQTNMVIYQTEDITTIPIADIDTVVFNGLDTAALNGHEYVDMGLSVMWAPVNVDVLAPNKEADTPEDYGSYAGWGDPTGLLTSTDDNDYLGQFPPSNICGTSNDIARVQWGGAWRLPTYDEFIAFPWGSCDYEWTTLNGKHGYKVTGPNGNSIFLPAAGFYLDSYMPGLLDEDVDGGYWTGESFIDSKGNAEARYLFMLKDYFDVSFFVRSALQSVRPVIQAETMVRKKNGITLFFPIRNIERITFENE